jgi:polysaccharide deacetylase family sporulation protein PdaB
LVKFQNSLLRLLIFILIIFTILLCIHQEGDSLVSAMAENKSYSLPIYSVDTEEQVVSITFDAAWGDEDLDDILATLEQHSCRATFFVTGEWAMKYPEAIQKIYGSGHDLGNHGNKHKHMTQLSQEEMLEEIEGCEEVVKSICGYKMSLIRAPYGDYNEDVVLAAIGAGYQIIQWDVDSLDWKDYGRESIINTVCQHKSLGNGSIILLHNGATYTAAALDELLTNLEEQGYSFVPVSELIYTEDYYIDHTGRQFHKNNGA